MPGTFHAFASRRVTTACITLLLALTFSQPSAQAEGNAWEPFVAFPASPSGRTRAVAMFHQGTLFVLGGEPYRCPDDLPCGEPERGAADYLPPGGTDWLPGAPFDDGLNRLGGGIDGNGRPVAFGGARFDDLQGGQQTFFYDIELADQTEPTLARRNFRHTNFAWARDDRGRLYAVGGGPGAQAAPGSPNATDVERYDAQSDTWTVLAPMPEGRAAAAAVFDGQGHILVFGGYDALGQVRASSVLSYDIASDSWSVLGQLPIPPAGGNAFTDQRAELGANGKVYVVGGINGPVGSGTTRAYVYTFEPVAGVWGFAPELLTPRHGAALALAEDGWLYALGGFAGSTGLSSSERLDTSPSGSECVLAEDCSDGLDCNGAEFCVDGACVAGNPVMCDTDEICISGGSCRVRRYEIIDLSALLGDSSGTATAVNAAGIVVGEHVDSTDGHWHGFTWDGQSMRDLGPGRARAIADDGWIVGEDGTAFVIDPTGQRIDLGTLGGGTSSALGVSSGGWVVGQSRTTGGDDHAFLVRGPGAAMEDLGTLGDYSLAHAIDPQGRVYGESLVVTFDPHAEPFVFDTTLADPVMVPLSGPYSAGSARASNDAGHVTGWVSNNVDSWGHAFVHDGVTITDLGAIPGKSYSIGTGINGFDHVVGYAFGEWIDTDCCGRIWSNSIHRAYFHDGTAGINLNDELPESSGWILSQATDINDAGLITGTGTRDGLGRAFLLMPLAEVDGDGDGVPDALDNCPADVNPAQGNADSDLFGNACDNCTLVGNDDQRDTNGDGYGNFCDPDLDDNGFINLDDFLLLRAVLFTDDPDADFDGSGLVDLADVAIMRTMFRRPPGPSSEAP
jgi:probable HAF family extracellular repeat protein